MPDARFVAELIGHTYCEVIPTDMPAEALAEGLASLRGTIGEVSVSDGDFTLAAIDRERYSGSMRLQGHVRMDGSESPVALQIDAELAGIRELENVPTLTSDGS